MTLPLNYKLPEPTESSIKDGDPTNYLKDLVFELETMYETTTQNVNGFFRNNLDVDGSEYIPTLKGQTTPGTFTYSRQSSYVLRQGIMTDVWYDIIWSTIGGATGELRMILPYKSNPHPGLFFSGVAYMDNANFGAGKTYVVGATLNDTFDLSFQSCGSLTTTASVNVYANGRVGGHIRYIGIEDE